MKIYVNEESQDVRVDFGGEEYARVSISRFTGQVFTEDCPASWLPNVLGDSELVYETPAPPLEWPTKPHAVVEAVTNSGHKGTFISGRTKPGFWTSTASGLPYGSHELTPERIIFEGEDTL